MINYNSRLNNEPKNTLLFIHGFLESNNIWDKYIKSIDKNINYINISIPGHGNSDSEFTHYELIDMANYINKILVKYNINSVILVGHSMGGYINLAFAELFPKKVKGMILMNSSALPDTETKKQDRKKLIELVKQNRTGFIKDTIPNLFPAYNHAKFKIEIDEIREMAAQVSSEGINYALQAMINRPDRTHVLKTANYPVLFIIGKDDPIIDYQKIKEQTVLPKISRVLELDKVGHMAFIEAEKETFEAMDTFIEYCVDLS